MRTTILGALGALLIATSSWAEPTATIYLRGTDLQTQSGTALSYRRLQSAAELVCARYDGRELARHHVFSQCVTQTLDDTVARLHNPLLAAFHAQKSKNDGSANGVYVIKTATR